MNHILTVFWRLNFAKLEIVFSTNTNKCSLKFHFSQIFALHHLIIKVDILL